MFVTTYLTNLPEEKNATPMTGQAPGWERRVVVLFSFFGLAAAIGHAIGLY